MQSASHTTRRRFLKTTAAAIAAPIIVPASAIGAGGPPPSDRIVLGMIGMGKMCGGHLGSMLRRTDVRVAAVCDVDGQKRARALKRSHDQYNRQDPKHTMPRTKGYNDFRRVLDRSDIDAILTATPDHWHAIIAVRAAQAGKDIYCEKPLSLTIHEARAMVRAVRRYGRVFQTGSQQRSNDQFRLACELVRSGRIGKVHTVHVNCGGPSVPCHLPAEPVPDYLDWDLWLGPAPLRPYHPTISPPISFHGWPQWRRFRDYSGGSMTDIGHHHFDIAQWGLGMDRSGPVEIIPPEHSPQKLLTYKYANGVTMFHGGGNASVHFIGTTGEVMTGRWYCRTDPPEIAKTPLRPNEVHLYRSPNHHSDWLDCIRTRQRPVADVEIGCRSVTVCHLGNLAYWLKRPLRWDPANERFVGDAEANRWLDRPKRAPWRL